MKRPPRMPDELAGAPGRGCDATASAPGGLRGLGAKVKWYVHSVMGDNRYERYLAHHQLNHPDVAPLTKREYYREQADRQDRNPTTRCC